MRPLRLGSTDGGLATNCHDGGADSGSSSESPAELLGTQYAWLANVLNIFGLAGGFDCIAMVRGGPLAQAGRIGLMVPMALLLEMALN